MGETRGNRVAFTAHLEKEDDEGTDFRRLGVHTTVVRALVKNSITKPKPIQSAAFPLIDFRNYIIRAECNSGKTVLYLIKVLCHLSYESDVTIRRCPFAIIILPTLQLCEKVFRQLESLVACLVHKPKFVMLTDPKPSPELFSDGYPDIVISTAGCLLSCLDVPFLRNITTPQLPGLKYLILDEIDLVSPCAYEDDVISLVTCVSDNSRRFLFCSNPSSDVRALRKLFTVNPPIVTLHESGHVSHEIIPYNAEQSYIMCDADLKLCYLMDLLRFVKSGLVVFTNSSDTSCELKLFIEKMGKRAALLDAKASDKDSRLEDWNVGLFDCIVVTEDDHIKPCGLKLKNVQAVVNFDMPQSASGYARRIYCAEWVDGIGTCISMVYCKKDRRILDLIMSSLEKEHGDPSRIIFPYSIPEDYIIENYRDRVEYVRSMVREALGYDASYGIAGDGSDTSSSGDDDANEDLGRVGLGRLKRPRNN